MDSKDFDFVVVGAGSAGCALASRLSADPANRVLLLEAGPPDRSPWLHVPAGYYRSIFNPRIGWGYESEPVPGCNARRIGWPRGKVLGGCSAINGLVYIRGQREDFDHWRQLGNEGWGYDDVLPYFRRAERQQRGADEWHGADGPLGVSDSHRNELCEAYIAAAEQAGLARNEDFNGATQEGVGYYQLTTWKGWRSSTASAYLKPARARANLRVVSGAHVMRVLFEGRRAVGVAYRRDGRVLEARAAGEVILCGGAVNSPQLLQLSGIGPGALLREHGIEVLCERPGVGEDLQDHYQCRSVYECTRRLTLNDEVRSPARRLAALWRWLLHRDGPLTVGAGHVGVFARTRPELASPDVQFHFIRFSVERAGGNLHPFSGFTASVCHLRPESRGHVRIRSPDPFEHPLIQPNYLATEGDRRTMLDALALARRIVAMPAMQGLVRREVLPGPEVVDEAAMLDYLRAAGSTIFHPASGCRMGRDAMAVVDARLRVHGVERLRVADASVMPTIVSGNTNAPCIMIGEKAADLVLEDARRGY